MVERYILTDGETIYFAPDQQWVDGARLETYADATCGNCQADLNVRGRLIRRSGGLQRSASFYVECLACDEHFPVRQ